MTGDLEAPPLSGDALFLEDISDSLVRLGSVAAPDPQVSFILKCDSVSGNSFISFFQLMLPKPIHLISLTIFHDIFDSTGLVQLPVKV